MNRYATSYGFESDISYTKLNIPQEIPGLTDVTVPKRLGPKRASKIRKLFNLAKEDDVRQYVIKRPLPKKEGKKQRFRSPKIQRLVTPVVLQVSEIPCSFLNITFSVPLQALLGFKDSIEVLDEDHLVLSFVSYVKV